MKIRTGFVTNSSSSSFVAVTITGKNGLRLQCNLDEYCASMQENAFYAAKTTPELIQALCSSLWMDSLEDQPNEFINFADKLQGTPLEEIDAVEFERVVDDFGEFVCSHVEDETFTDYQETEDGGEIEVEVELDPDDVKSVHTRYVDVVHRKFKIVMHSMEKDIELYEGNLYSDEYSTRSIAISEDITVLEPDAFSFSGECIYLKKVIFLGRLETIEHGALDVFAHHSALIIAPKTPLAKFCGKIKENAILGFASCWNKKPSLRDDVYEYEPDIQSDYLQYIQSHREELAALAEKNPDLQNLLQKV